MRTTEQDSALLQLKHALRAAENNIGAYYLRATMGTPMGVSFLNYWKREREVAQQGIDLQDANLQEANLQDANLLTPEFGGC